MEEHLFEKIEISEAVSVSYDTKCSVLGLRLGDPMSKVEQVLNERGLKFERTNREFQISISTSFILSESSANLYLAIGSDNDNTVSYFYFYNDGPGGFETSPFSPTLAQLSVFLQRQYNPLVLIKYNFDYKRRTTFNDHKLQEAWYSSYYEVFHLRRSYHNVSMTIMSMEEYERKNMPVWRSIFKKIRSIMNRN